MLEPEWLPGYVSSQKRNVDFTHQSSNDKVKDIITLYRSLSAQNRIKVIDLISISNNHDFKMIESIDELKLLIDEGKQFYCCSGESWNEGPDWGNIEPVKNLILDKEDCLSCTVDWSYQKLGDFTYEMNYFMYTGIWSRYQGSEHLLKILIKIDIGNILS